MKRIRPALFIVAAFQLVVGSLLLFFDENAPAWAMPFVCYFVIQLEQIEHLLRKRNSEITAILIKETKESEAKK